MGRSCRWRARFAAGLVALALNAVPAWAQEAPSSTTTPPAPVGPTVVGPVAGDAGRHGRPLTAATEALADRGYVEEEVFLEGAAAQPEQAGRWGEDGRWSTTPGPEAPYRTRLLVRRPVDPAAFSGTVVVSWLDVGAGFDRDVEWAQLGEELMRQGAAWVGVSAQSLGVEGPFGARRWDPDRYGPLALADDRLGYEVFTQAGEAIATPGAVDPLAGLPGERRLVATGQSQAAQRLVTYVNAFHPDAGVYDGFLLVSRFRGAAPLGTALLPSRDAWNPDAAGPDDPILPDPLVALLSGPPVAQIRADTDVPVFVVVTETEAVQDTVVRRPDSDRFRTWEIAGAAHVDTTATAATKAKLARDLPRLPRAQLDCPDANAFPTRYALRAAMRAMTAWVDEGTPPPTAKPIARTDDGQIRRDSDGNALGGLRLPDLDVPTATHTGESDRKGYCGLTGSSVPFDEGDLADRYPTPEGYAQALAAAVDDAVAAGHLLPEDAAGIVDSAPNRLVAARSGSAAVADAIAAPAAAETGAAAPESSGAPSGPASNGATGTPSAPAAGSESASGGRGWMATTGRDLLTPVLVGLLLVLNGRVVLTVAQQRRRGSGRRAFGRRGGAD